jgi:hypothetical protein
MISHFVDTRFTDGGEIICLRRLAPGVDSMAAALLERLNQLKDPMTSSGIEPATFYVSLDKKINFFL